MEELRRAWIFFKKQETKNVMVGIGSFVYTAFFLTALCLYAVSGKAFFVSDLHSLTWSIQTIPGNMNSSS